MVFGKGYTIWATFTRYPHEIEARFNVLKDARDSFDYCVELAKQRGGGKVYLYYRTKLIRKADIDDKKMRLLQRERAAWTVWNTDAMCRLRTRVLSRC